MHPANLDVLIQNFDCLSEDNILGNLYTRLVGLCIKEAEELNKKNIFLNGTYT